MKQLLEVSDLVGQSLVLEERYPLVLLLELDPLLLELSDLGDQLLLLDLKSIGIGIEVNCLCVRDE